MIGLLLVTHAGLAEELLAAAEMIVGKIELAETVGIKADAKVDGIMADIKGSISKLSGKGVIIMTDMFGGTPSNVSLSFLEDNKVEVLTGVNLPMVIKFATERKKCGVTELAQKLKECGLESITVAGEYLKK